MSEPYGDAQVRAAHAEWRMVQLTDTLIKTRALLILSLIVNGLFIGATLHAGWFI